MEPNMVDYYNELPSGINVIDKMNEEYETINNKCKSLEIQNDRLKSQIIRIKKIILEQKRTQELKEIIILINNGKRTKKFDCSCF
jgi:hypothetical protein